MADLLGAVRLSDVTDETTSPERQKAHIKDYATSEKHDVIHVAEDVDVSGAVSPFARTGLGPWLRAPLLDRWQILAVAKLDRLTRSILDFETLWKFLEANGKSLVSVAEDMEFGTPSGRLLARQLVMFAEYEREMIRSRIKDAYDSLHKNGHYAGLQFPFGYVPYRLEPKGYGYKPHEIYAPKLAEVVDRLIAGESLHSLCRSLDDEGIPTPRNAVREYSNEMRKREGKPERPLPAAKWKTTSLTKVLKSESIVGAAMTGGKPLRDEYGRIIYRAEPIIDRGKWEQLKRILDKNADRQGPRVNSSPLLRVAFCLSCKAPLYIARVTTGGKEYRYYKCPTADRDKNACASRRVPADWLENLIVNQLVTKIGNRKRTEEKIEPASDNSIQMAELSETIGHLSGRIAFGKAMGDDASELEETRAGNERQLAELAKLPTQPARTITRKLAETYAQYWATLDQDGRNAFLRSKGAKVFAVKHDGGPFAVIEAAYFGITGLEVGGESPDWTLLERAENAR